MTTAEWISNIVAFLSLAISVITAWMTLFRTGEVKMTQPTTIFLGPDGTPDGKSRRPPKVYLRTLLYSTAKRGRIVENMFVRLSRSETTQVFSIWVCGDEGSLGRGSGLFVGEEGVTYDQYLRQN